jgi:hypothetical protein
MNLTILNPLEISDWDSQILALPGHSFFHSAAWARVLHESYGYRPLYFSLMEGGHMRALLPMMEVNSFLTGRRGVSLPFTDFCDPLAETEEDLREMWSAVKAAGQEKGWKTAELRSVKGLSGEAAAASYYYHTLSLKEGREAVSRGLKDTHKRNIKKAGKAGVTVELGRDVQGVREFCRLNTLTRRDHGLPPQPSFFFEAVGRNIVGAGRGFVSLARYQGETIAGAVYFHFGRRAVYKYGASNKAFQTLRANNLVMWEAIRWLAENGFEELHFGRTDLDHEGLRRFKNGWGTEESRIDYRRYDFKTGHFKAPPASEGSGLSEKVFRHMPIFALEKIGALLYRHVG